MGGGLRVGVIGVGRMGALHVATLRALDNVAAITVADADPARARLVSTRIGAAIAGSPEELVEAGIDALVIAAATPAHVPLLRLAAAAALPTFCEKPVALDLATMDDVLDRVERAG